MAILVDIYDASFVLIDDTHPCVCDYVCAGSARALIFSLLLIFACFIVVLRLIYLFLIVELERSTTCIINDRLFANFSQFLYTCTA